MHSAHEIAEALARAGIEQLPPPARAHLARRLALGFAGGEASNPAGLRDTSFGCAKSGAIGPAVFADLDAGARAAVANAFRAAPRDWGAADDATIARLGGYPIHRARATVGDVTDVAKAYAKTVVGPATLVTDYLFGPSAEEEATFRGLVADWEAYDRVGVGTKVLPEHRDDAVAWRTFRDEWRAGSIPGNEHAGRLNAQVSISNMIRRRLKETGVIDPLLQQDERRGVDVEQSSIALAKSAELDKMCRESALCDWMTKPGQKLIKTPLGPMPENIAIGAGVGAGVIALLGIATAIRAVRG